MFHNLGINKALILSLDVYIELFYVCDGMRGNFIVSFLLIKAGADHDCRDRLEGGDQRGSPLVAPKPGPVWSQELKQNFTYNRNQYRKYWWFCWGRTTNLQ